MNSHLYGQIYDPWMWQNPRGVHRNPKTAKLQGPGLLSVPASLLLYSPECVEGAFSEVRIRHPRIIVFGKARRATPRLCENRATATTCGGVHKDLSYRTMRWPVADSLALCLCDES